jgi:DNA-binding MarR family transcriptional regulator
MASRKPSSPPAAQRARLLDQSIDSIVSGELGSRSALELRLGLAVDASEVALLRELHRHGRRRMGELREALGLAGSTATETVDRMIAKGLLQRERDEADRRVVSVALTALGTEAATEYAKARLRVCDEVLSGMSDAEQALLVEALARLALRSQG